MKTIDLLSAKGQVLFFVMNHENCKTREVISATGLHEKAVYMALRRLALEGCIVRTGMREEGTRQMCWAAAEKLPPAVDRGWFRKRNEKKATNA